MEIEANKNGLKLPPGFRFHPTDEELVLHYLKRKVYSFPLPSIIIPDIDLSKFDPWEIIGEEERYLFNGRESKYRNCNRSRRAMKSGYWKAIGKERLIVSSESNQIIGMKKALVFYQGKPSKGSRTNYIMHEYRLAGFDSRPRIFLHRNNSSAHGFVACNGDWVLCRIFKKKRATKIEESETNEESLEDRSFTSRQTQFTGFMNRQNGYGDLDSCPTMESSCVTEMCDDCSEEETSPAI